MKKIYFDETEDILDIRYDNVFKAVFARDNQTSKGALSKLISALICKDIKVVTINTNEPPIDNIKDRQIRFDINCKAKSGELIKMRIFSIVSNTMTLFGEYH